MKRVTVLLLILVTVLSCSDEIKFNSPAIQGFKDGQFWRSSSFAADIDFGGFLIEGAGNVETLQLITNNDIRGTYELGGENPSVAIFKDVNGLVYSTANEPDPSLSLYPSDGQIIIEDITRDDPKQISGSFWFNAYTADGMNYINFSRGVLFDVPLVGGLLAIDNGSACLQARQQVDITRNAYNEVDSNDPEYTDVCNAYKQALIVRISACGDDSGVIQSTIDSLGDCQ